MNRKSWPCWNFHKGAREDLSPEGFKGAVGQLNTVDFMITVTVFCLFNMLMTQSFACEAIQSNVKSWFLQKFTFKVVHSYGTVTRI